MVYLLFPTPRPAQAHKQTINIGALPTPPRSRLTLNPKPYKP